jgi:hypothetical protein
MNNSKLENKKEKWEKKGQNKFGLQHRSVCLKSQFLVQNVRYQGLRTLWTNTK